MNEIDVYGPIVQHLLTWIDQGTDKIPHFYAILGAAVGLFVLIIMIRELGKSISVWRRNKG